MSNPLPVHVVAVTAEIAGSVRALRLAAGQHAYVGDIGFNLTDAERDPFSDAMAVMLGDRVIGFYRLDRAPNTIAGRDLGEPTLGLRGLLIDRPMQRQGLGPRALLACIADARRRYPGHRLLALAVHGRNQGAIRIYEAAGFCDTGDRLPGGAAGPQRLMLLRLQSSSSSSSPASSPDT